MITTETALSLDVKEENTPDKRN